MYKNIEKINNALIEKGVVRYGNFTLKSEEKTNFYVDFRKIVSDKSLLKHISSIVENIIVSFQSGKKTTLVGIPTMGQVMVSAMSQDMVVYRDRVKQYGDSEKKFEGDLELLKNCIIFDDIMTSGNTVNKCVSDIKEFGGDPELIVVLLNRGEVKNIQGVPVLEIFHLNRISRYHRLRNKKSRKLYEIMIEKKTGLIFSADMDTWHENLTIINKISKYICAVKIHNRYKDCSMSNDLRNIVSNLNLMIIDDEKLADVSYINNKLVTPGDMVTCHSLMGYDTIKNTNFDLILLAKMTTSNNLMDEDYVRKTVAMARYCNNVCGFITNRILSYDFLNMSPGITLKNENDNIVDSTYVHIDKALERGIDCAIVGREIYNAENPEKIASEFQDKFKRRFE
jgi:orotidine 5'-phosphate decarboxylase subfamily 1/orotate phosphoribosyltransferase